MLFFPESLKVTGKTNNQGTETNSSYNFPSVRSDITNSKTTRADKQIPIIDINQLPTGKIFLARQYFRDFYYHIWVIPHNLIAANVKPNSVIPFSIWNAFPYDNRLVDIKETPTGQLGFDISLQTNFSQYELKKVSLSILAKNTEKVVSDINFLFSTGVGRFHVELSLLASQIILMPETQLSETWEWNTNIIVNRIGGEQRIALREVPRRRVKGYFTIDSNDLYKLWTKHLFENLGGSINITMPQYTAHLLQDCYSGDSILKFDNSLCDTRVGEDIYITGERDEGGTTLSVKELLADGVTIETPLSGNYPQGSRVMPVIPMVMPDGSILKFDTLVGSGEVDLIIDEPRKDFSRPGATPDIIYCDEIIVLDKRPLTNQPMRNTYNRGYRIIDNEKNKPHRTSLYKRSYHQFDGEWYIPRDSVSNDMDWWRTVLTRVTGMQKPLLVPSWHDDFEVAIPPEKNKNIITLKGSDYHTIYFPHKGTLYLWILTGAGYIARRVLNSKLVSDGNNELELGEAFGASDADIDISSISLLYLSRLGSDYVTFSHEDMYSIVNLSIRTVDG